MIHNIPIPRPTSIKLYSSDKLSSLHLQADQNHINTHIHLESCATGEPKDLHISQLVIEDNVNVSDKLTTLTAVDIAETSRAQDIENTIAINAVKQIMDTLHHLIRMRERQLNRQIGRRLARYQDLVLLLASL
jgi:hypothetical protein